MELDHFWNNRYFEHNRFFYNCLFEFPFILYRHLWNNLLVLSLIIGSYLFLKYISGMIFCRYLRRKNIFSINMYAYLAYLFYCYYEISFIFSRVTKWNTSIVKVRCTHARKKIYILRLQINICAKMPIFLFVI